MGFKFCSRTCNAKEVTLTNYSKQITSGRPRPDMFDRCQPPTGIQNPPLHLLNYTICTTDHNTYDFKDGFKSFPSGHSSFSFAGLGYLSFYLAGKMHLFDRGGVSDFCIMPFSLTALTYCLLQHTYKSFIFSFPFLGALLVATTRVSDYRHHWSDVFVGGIIGKISLLIFFSLQMIHHILTHCTTCRHRFCLFCLQTILSIISITSFSKAFPTSSQESQGYFPS